MDQWSNRANSIDSEVHTREDSLLREAGSNGPPLYYPK